MEKYSKLIRKVNYKQISNGIEYLIKHQINISNHAKNIEIYCEEEFEEIKDIQVPYSFNAQNLKERMLVTHKVLNDEQIDEMIMKQNVELQNIGFNDRYQIKNQEGMK